MDLRVPQKAEHLLRTDKVSAPNCCEERVYLRHKVNFYYILLAPSALYMLVVWLHF